MELLYPICCGLDVHQASVTACLRSPGDGARRRQEVRTFGTTTRELLRLVDWLTAAITSSKGASSSPSSTPST
jgi:transposase